MQYYDAEDGSKFVQEKLIIIRVLSQNWGFYDSLVSTPDRPKCAHNVPSS